MTDKIRIKLFYPNYFSFLVNGAMVLLVGAILPYIIDEAGISYTVAGSFLSAFAIGNFLASFINPALTKVLGRKSSIILTSILMPLTLVGISFIPSVPVTILLFVLLGISRGCYSIINNAYINENSDGSPFALNILHMTFAIGAFSAPMIMSALFKFGFSWRAIVYTIAAASTVSVVLLSRLRLNDAKPGTPTERASSAHKNSFWKHPIFYVSGLILFFYLGLENCVNGWFVTYFKDTGVIPKDSSIANSLVSFTWLAVLFGRLVTALISSKVRKQTIILGDCIATALFFILLISTKNLAVITISILGLGFFFAGIYATTVANAHAAISGSDVGTSMLLAVAALGGILTPQIVGSIADKVGLTGAVSILLVNVCAMIVLSVVNAAAKSVLK